MSAPNTAEQYSSHIPALQILIAMGWTFMSAEECLAARGGTGEVILPNALIETLRKRRFHYKGREYPLSTNAIEQIVRELSSPSLHEGLLAANERLYNTLCLGVTVTEFIDGKKHSPTIPIIDWDNPASDANSFVVTEELEVLSSDGTHARRPDVVCYVNGIPLAIIEAKRPDSGNPNKSMLDEGISQSIRNQKNEEIPHLFAYSQLLLSVSGTDGRYATTKTPRKFWARWREEELDEAYFSGIKNRPLPDAVKHAIFANRPQKNSRVF
jgi:type I restriction enzyme R subunit